MKLHISQKRKKEINDIIQNKLTLSHIHTYLQQK